VNINYLTYLLSNIYYFNISKDVLKLHTTSTNAYMQPDKKNVEIKGNRDIQNL